MAEAEGTAADETELIDVLLQHRMDILFSRQLMLHPDNPAFAKTFRETTEHAIPLVLPVWAKLIGLPTSSGLAELVLRMSLHNFFLQLTAKTYTEAWMSGYFMQVRGLVAALRDSGSPGGMDASV